MQSFRLLPLVLREVWCKRMHCPSCFPRDYAWMWVLRRAQQRGRRHVRPLFTDVLGPTFTIMWKLTGGASSGTCALQCAMHMCLSRPKGQ